MNKNKMFFSVIYLITVVIAWVIEDATKTMTPINNIFWVIAIILTIFVIPVIDIVLSELDDFRLRTYFKSKVKKVDTDADIERKLRLRQAHYNYTQDDMFKDFDFVERVIKGGWNNQLQRDTISALFLNLMNKWKEYDMYRHHIVEERINNIILSLN